MSKDEKTPRRMAIEEIYAERNRQDSKEGWDALHDDLVNKGGQLSKVAALYALCATLAPDSPSMARYYHALWPFSWERHWWKPHNKSRRRRLVVAGALILAELERLARLGELK